MASNIKEGVEEVGKKEEDKKQEGNPVSDLSKQTKVEAEKVTDGTTKTGEIIQNVYDRTPNESRHWTSRKNWKRRRRA